MVYAHLDYLQIQSSTLRKPFERADLYLHDTYGMFPGLPVAGSDGTGAGNFGITLILLCVIDGLASAVWPRRSVVTDQETRFKQLVRHKLPWGSPEGRGKWLHKGTA